MFESRPFYQKSKFWRTIVGIIFLMGFYLAFRSELLLVWEVIKTTFALIILREPVTLPLTLEKFRAVILLSLNCVLVFGGFFLTLAWISQFVLPVRNKKERRNAIKRLNLYAIPFLQLHGPAIFVKEGKAIAGDKEMDDLRPGVAFVDASSAIVLEKQWSHEKTDVTIIQETDSAGDNVNNIPMRQPFSQRLFSILLPNQIYSQPTIVRSAGPGIVFTNWGEKIHGIADLRKQFRIRLEVCGYTRDGIELKTNVFAGFTLGLPAEVLSVTMVDGRLQAIQLGEQALAKSNGETLLAPTKVIKGFSNELDSEDQAEITQFVKKYHSQNVGLYQPEPVISPFCFDAERVFTAVYSRARDAKAGMLGAWTDLPAHAATEVFRNMLIHQIYDNLYLPDDPEEFPLHDFKRDFSTAVRNLGVLAYQFVTRKDGRPMEVGQIWKEEELFFYPKQELKGSAVLRDRGIRVIFAGFSELTPTSDIIHEQWLDNWCAYWQQKAEKTIADHELQAARIRNFARAQAQQDMIYSLSQLFRTGQYTEEAIAIRLYQALETAGTNPATRRLLPRDTIRMLWNLRQWLLPEQPEQGESDNYSDDQIDDSINPDPPHDDEA